MTKPQEKNKEEHTNNVVDPKIEAIKEIIFGDNIKEYESEFKKLSDIIDKQKLELEGKLNEFRQEAGSLLAQASKDFDTQLSELRNDLSQKIADLAEAKLDRKTFADALKSLADKIVS